MVNNEGNYVTYSSEYDTGDSGLEEQMVAGLPIDLVTSNVRVPKKPVPSEAGNKEQSESHRRDYL